MKFKNIDTIDLNYGFPKGPVELPGVVELPDR